MKKIVLISIIFAGAAFSQSILGVRYPIGISYPLSTTSARMSGTGTALKEPYLTSSLNPANLGNINQSVYSLALNVDYVRVKEDGEHTDFSRFSPAFIGFAFPMGKAGTLGANFKQNSANRYSFKENSYLINPVLKDTIPQILKFDNNTSLSAWEFGWGIELFRRISIGASYQIGQYKNRISRSDILETTIAESALDSVYFKQSSSAVRGGIAGYFGKFGIAVSATYPFADDLESHRTVKKITMNKDNEFSKPTLVHNLSVFDTTYKMQLPPSGNIGLSWTFSDKLKTATDFSLTLWEGYYWTDAPALSYRDGEYTNAFSAAAGIQFIPQPNLLSSRYFQKVRYSGGLAYRELPIDGDYEVSISAGIGLPLGTKGIVDFSIETGLRRSELNLKENFVRINFGMSGGQVWKKASNNVY